MTKIQQLGKKAAKLDPGSALRKGEMKQVLRKPVKEYKSIAGQIARGTKRRRPLTKSKNGLMDKIKSGVSKVKKWLGTSDGKMSI